MEPPVQSSGFSTIVQAPSFDNSSYDDPALDRFSCDDGSDDGSDKIYHPDGLDVKVMHGVVWFWLLEKWQSIPNEQWAWKLIILMDAYGVRHQRWTLVVSLSSSFLLRLSVYLYPDV